MQGKYLIWSNQHKGWWGPQRAGYVARIEDAGVYSATAAMQICTDAIPGRRGKAPLPELPVLLEDVQFMLQRYKSVYPTHDPEPNGD